MSTITETLSHTTTRWKFVAFVIGTGLLLLLLRYVFLPGQLDNTVNPGLNFLARSMEAAAVALFTGLAIHALALWIGPDRRAITLIRVLDRRIETDPTFERAFKTTQNRWYFKGGFGTFFRDKTLPALIQAQKTRLDIFIAVLDTNDDELVRAYADYRRQASGDDSINAQKVRAEIHQTIQALAQAVSEHSGAFASATIAFVKAYSPFRLDLHDMGVVLTQDNKTAPAIEFSSESTYYAGFREELEQLKRTGRDLVRLRREVDLTDGQRVLEFLDRQ